MLGTFEFTSLTEPSSNRNCVPLPSQGPPTELAPPPMPVAPWIRGRWLADSFDSMSAHRLLVGRLPWLCFPKVLRRLLPLFLLRFPPRFTVGCAGMLSNRLCLQHNDTPELIPKLAQRAEEWGYQRLWLGEHHTPLGIGDPVVTTAVAAALTNRIRIGPAGIMLRARSCYRVAEDFDQLEHMFPRRIDLGIVRSLPAGDLANQLLDGRIEQDLSEFENKARILNEMIQGVWNAAQLTSPFSASTLPELWNCGFSERSARLAAELGSGFAFHFYFWRQQNLGGWSDERWETVLETYRQQFQPQDWRTEPRVIVALFGMCAATEAEARHHWNLKMLANPTDGEVEKPVLEPDFLGTAEQCVDQIESVRLRLNADEIVIRCLTDEPAALFSAYESIASRAFND